MDRLPNELKEKICSYALDTVRTDEELVGFLTRMKTVAPELCARIIRVVDEAEKNRPADLEERTLLQMTKKELCTLAPSLSTRSTKSELVRVITYFWAIDSESGLRRRFLEMMNRIPPSMLRQFRHELRHKPDLLQHIVDPDDLDKVCVKRLKHGNVMTK